MKKLLLLILPILSYGSNIDKIIYNGEENSQEISLSSNLREGNKLDIKDIDLLVDNFKFVSSNDMKVNIEPSNKKDYVNVVVNNKKKNPFKLSFGIDNYGNSVEDGKYRYTLETGLSGLILNENINLSYTFVTPKNPKRLDNIPDLKPGEIANIEIKKDLRKARKNNNLNIELSFPIKRVKSYLTYSYSDYKKSIVGNNDIYDVSGKSHRVEVKEKVEVYRNKKQKANLIGKYSYIKRESYLEDVKINTDKIVKKWNLPIRNWGIYYSELTILYGRERLEVK